jgi:protoporphyrinogen oxidase
MTDSIGILGGGLLGLSLAHRLSKQGHRVTVLEAADHIGGMAAPWKLGDVTWDRFYHVILMSDTFTHDLLKELKLKDEFVGVETKTGFYTDGRFHSMSNSVEFLKFPPLGLLSKFRLGLTIMRASRIKDWQAMEQLDCVKWLQKWSGKRTVEKIWRPLLKAKLGDSHSEASAAFIWATIQRMYAARRSGLKKELFGYVRGGYGRIVSAFVEHLQNQGVELRTNAAVAQVTSSAVGPVVRLQDGESLQFDRVICTAAPPLAAKLLDLNQEERDRLLGIRYQGIVCASLLLDRPLNPFYVTNLTDDWVPFTGVIEMSALVDRAEFGGKSLVYLPKYVSPDDAIFNESDDSIRKRFTEALAKMYPDFATNTIHAFQVARLRHVFPIPVKHYSKLVPPMQTSLPGVYLVNSANIVNGTLNVNETLQLAAQATATITSNQHAQATV